MKKYKVKVNGKVYEVELETVEETSGSIATPVTSAPQVSNSVGGTEVKAPIGGKVLDIKVSVGQKVEKGQVVCIIEAMKMENEVNASASGVVKEIKVSKGAQVANKDTLIILG